MLGIYCRISVDREGQKSIELQKTLGKRFAEKNKFAYQIYVDKGISGAAKIEDRPSFSRMLDDIANGTLDSIYAFDQDRLERDELTWYTLVNIITEKKIKLYIDAKLIDFEDDSVRILTSIKSIMNADKVRRTGKKIKSQLLENYANGLVHGKPNFGYKSGEGKKMVIHEEHAEIVRKIYELNLKGWGQRRITEWLIENNIPNGRKNRKWGSTTLQHILCNPIYKGIREIGGKVYESPVIIDTVLWQQVQDSKNPSGKGNNYKYLLNKSLTCGKCYSRYTGRFLKNPHDNVYRCVTKQYKGSTCDNRGINQPKLEWFVWNKFFMDKKLLELVKEWFITTDIEVKTNELKKAISKYQKKLKNLSRQQENAIKLVMDNPERAGVFDVELNRIDGEKKSINNKLKNFEEELYEYTNSKDKVTSAEDDLKNLNNDTPFNLRQEFIQKWIRTIDVSYINGIYILNFHFNVPDMKMETFIIDRYWKNMKDEITKPKFIPKF
ncbi:MAG: site-specific DNA recombinase [Candidatus Paceibacteria bacterium]|jgi:site-specific DNA recombinase